VGFDADLVAIAAAAIDLMARDPQKVENREAQKVENREAQKVENREAQKVENREVTTSHDPGSQDCRSDVRHLLNIDCLGSG